MAWQYAQAVCLPAGARLGSNSVCWTNRTNGRSGCRPAATSASEATISANVPPRWTVAARAVSGAVHGIGPSRAQSILKMPGPYRNARDSDGIETSHRRGGWRRATAARGRTSMPDSQHLTRREVEDHRPGLRELAEIGDPPIRDHLPAERSQFRDERIGDRAGAPASHRPAIGVCDEPEYEPEARGDRPPKGDHRVRGKAAE